MMIPIVVVAGATASGKTALSVELAKRLSGEIVSCDSMQIYKGMDIGTAKPKREEMQGVPHHMMDILEPSKSFSAAEFCTMARGIIADINARGKLPILAGGTGLYIDSLVNNIDFAEETDKSEIRNGLVAVYESEGADKLYEMLENIDPEYAKTVHKNNVKRVIRAIEFYKATGMTVTEHNKLPKTPIYKSVYFCIDWDRETLYSRINARVDEMIEAGLEQEAKSLYDKYGRQNFTALAGIGYKEFFDYFDGKKTIGEAVDEIKQGTRRYAKRQLTWFRRNECVHWLTPQENMVESAISIIKQELSL
ncbi:MAG: tRNA (adenosine(37)-N6)-dimethylallyltransferase MiaA [Clostridia bacterium]|nr:tRNA (adenosine(37)-N6)-dimethylallyltransferase MiaA [Clostridia bacterium]